MFYSKYKSFDGAQKFYREMMGDREAVVPYDFVKMYGNGTFFHYLVKKHKTHNYIDKIYWDSYYRDGVYGSDSRGEQRKRAVTEVRYIWDKYLKSKTSKRNLTFGALNGTLRAITLPQSERLMLL